ncbi:MAG: GNAT family acetyltransferase [Rhodospirillales bacterium]|nr:GNAT family acetyltransferase [Rhodospirillales bacterium]
MARKSNKAAKLDIRPYRQGDRDAVVALWEACELTRPWNDPDQDIALLSETSSAEILVGVVRKKIAATVMVGHDGHRGWIYYLAVDPASRARGTGAAIMRAAEAWLAERGLGKVMLMVRPGNLAVKRFYASLGYQADPCHLMRRWLDGREAPGIETDRDDGKLETTVTYLEMTERPPHPHLVPPLGMKLALLRARPPTVGFYRFLYNTVGGPWLWYERRALDDEALGRIITDDRVEIYVLYANGVPAGTPSWTGATLRISSWPTSA